MRQESLGRAAGDLIGYVHLFRESPDAGRPTVAALRAHLLKILDAFGRHSTAQTLSSDEVEAARFALVAWLDETILRSDWHGRDEWLQQLLQLELFRTNRAGTEFYDRLTALRPEMSQTREVFFLCLTMGFEGRLAGSEAERSELIRQQYEMLRVGGLAVDSATVSPLASAAYELEIEVHGSGGRLLWPALTTWLGGALAAVTILFAALWLLAGSVPKLPPA